MISITTFASLFFLTSFLLPNPEVNRCGLFDLPESITDGIKIVQQDSKTYIVSVASVANSSNQNTKSRISVVRARRNVSDYINGTTITSETILETREIVRNNSVEFYESFNERILEQGSGFVEGMQVACTWVSSDGKTFFTAIYRELN
jgi:hypothetical protein